LITGIMPKRVSYPRVSLTFCPSQCGFFHHCGRKSDRLGAREVRAKQVADGALITLLCARLGCHAARPLAMVPRSAYAAAAKPTAIAVARTAARSACRAEGASARIDRDSGVAVA
jgi:hypothetical protein